MNPTFAYTSRASAVESMSRVRPSGRVCGDLACVGGGDVGGACTQGEEQQCDSREREATKRSGYLVLLRWTG